MSLNDATAKLRENIVKMIQESIPVQTVWCVVKSVDWSKKTMVAEDTTHKLDYNDVLLGLDVLTKKPKVNTKCLIGILENKEAQAFLITCDELDAFEFQTTDAKIKLKVEDDTWTWNDGNNKGIPITPKVVQRLNNLENKVNQILAWTLTHTHTGVITGPSSSGVPSVGVNGTLTNTVDNDIENNKIKH